MSDTIEPTPTDAKVIVHFGGGALGRGLVIPTLIGSGCRVILADTSKPLIEKLKGDQCSYVLDITDAENRHQRMQLDAVIDSIAEHDRLVGIIRSCDVVTTSVRRENLKNVAPTIAEAWKDADDNDSKAVICCENVEHVGTFFHELLVGQDGLSSDQRARLDKVIVPDTVVDRICASDPDLNVSSETFYELAVDAGKMPETGIRLIRTEADIPACFARKRYLMNTYADLCSFIGLSHGLTYLYEAIRDDSINAGIEPYMQLLVDDLEAEYGIPRDSLAKWRTVYRSRLSNDRIPRDLTTVARDLWRKLTPEERFVSPVIQSLSHDLDVSPAFPVFQTLIESDKSVDSDEAMGRLEESWRTTPEGKRLFDLFATWKKDKE
jgi:mannitol-1-phosphate 5-dehydrogenase